MPSASILTLSSDKVLSGSLSTRDVDWDVETKYLDADTDHFNIGGDPRDLLIDAALDGEVYEVFHWVEDTSEGNFANGHHLGPTPSGAPSGVAGNWFIQRVAGRAARGFRSGPVLADSDGASWYSRVREFDSASITLRSARCRFGIIVGQPDPIAFAAARNSGYSVAATTETTLILPETVDVGGVYNAVNGRYTAPAGTELAVPMLNTYTTSSFNSGTCRFKLYKNGSAVAAFLHDGSGRSPGPGCFGLIEATENDYFELVVDNDSTSRTIRVDHAVEFYG